MSRIRCVMVSICFGLVIAGCGDNSSTRPEEYPGEYPGEPPPPDPDEAVAIIKRFFQHNPDEYTAVGVDTAMGGREVLNRKNLDVEILEALRTDTRPLRTKSPVSPGGSGVACTIVIHGLDYSLTINLDSEGFALGSYDLHRFINPSLAKILTDLYKSKGLLEDDWGQETLLRLRKGAGELPPMTDD